MIYYIDIDETICLNESEDRDYSKATPIKNNINKINKLYDEGHHVIYWTARGSISGLDWTDLTKSQLRTWGAKYHAVKLGKPHYDVFICDKAINSRNFFEE